MVNTSLTQQLAAVLQDTGYQQIDAGHEIPVAYACSCTRERALAPLTLLDRSELEDERRNSESLRLHRSREERLLGGEMPQDGRGRDLQLGPDIGERRLLESFRCEHAAGGVEEILGADCRRPSHL